MIKVHVINPPRHFDPMNLERDLKTFLGRDLSVQVVVANPPDSKMISEPWLHHQLDLRDCLMPNGILAADKETALRLPEDVCDDMTVAVIDCRGHLVKLAGPVFDPVDLAADEDKADRHHADHPDAATPNNFRKMQLCRSLQRTLAELGIRL